MSSHLESTITEADDGQRLDRWLKKNQSVPYHLIQKLVRKGAIRVDGKRVKADSKIYAGQIVRIPALEQSENALPRPYKLSDSDRELIKSIVIYDDGDIVAINKPAGLASQGGGEEKRHVDGMAQALENKAGLTPKLVHRLDKETSGVMVMARTAESVRALGKIFKSREVRKIYYALCRGVPAMTEGEIRAPIGKVKGPHKDKMTIDDEDGKPAVTDYIVCDKMGKSLSLVAFMPKTGRTHQIRVHASEILKCPIMGDARYGGTQDMEEESLEMMRFSKRLYLHAARLSFTHPVKNSLLDLIAPIPDDIRKSWDYAGFTVDLRRDPFEET